MLTIAPDHCPPDPEETAELYVLGMVDEVDAAAFEAHFFWCRTCLDALADMSDYVWMMRKALRRLAKCQNQ